MKQLPQLIGKEHLLQIHYAILRFMKNKTAYKTKQEPTDVIFSIKPIQEKNLPPQYHLHLRFPGKDHYTNQDEIIDLDLYLPIEELKKAIQ